MDNLSFLNHMIYMQNIVNNKYGQNSYNNVRRVRRDEDIPPIPDNWHLSPQLWKEFAIQHNITKDNVNDLEIKSEYVIRDGFGREIERYDPTERIASEHIGKPKNKENVEAMLKDITDAAMELDPRAKVIEKSDPNITINRQVNVRTETDELGNHRVILKDLDGDDYEVTDSGFVKLEQEEVKDRTEVDVAGVIEALEKIRSKIEERSASYEDNRTRWKCTYISELLYLIRNADRFEARILKRLRKKTTNNVLSFLETADEYLNPDELMIIFFSIYFIWVMCKDKTDKEKEDDGLRTLMY